MASTLSGDLPFDLPTPALSKTKRDRLAARLLTTNGSHASMWPVKCCSRTSGVPVLGPIRRNAKLMLPHSTNSVGAVSRVGLMAFSRPASGGGSTAAWPRFECQPSRRQVLKDEPRGKSHPASVNQSIGSSFVPARRYAPTARSSRHFTSTSGHCSELLDAQALLH